MLDEYPPRLDSKFYLTEGGIETEVLYKRGFELPEFAMFPLLDNADANEYIHGMYCRCFDVAEAYGTGLVITGHDYRASPDWAKKLGYSLEGLAEMQHRSIEFLTRAGSIEVVRRPLRVRSCLLSFLYIREQQHAAFSLGADPPPKED